MNFVDPSGLNMEMPGVREDGGGWWTGSYTVEFGPPMGDGIVNWTHVFPDPVQYWNGPAQGGGGGASQASPTDPCDDLRGEMDVSVNARRSAGTVEPKGLAQRYDQLAKYPVRTLVAHVREFQKEQKRLRKLLDNYRDQDCGDPPPQMQEWATKDLTPVVVKRLKDLGVTVASSGATGYAVYRLVRLLPSLLPVLWPTLIPNVATP